MKIYLINLDRNPDRLAHMRKQLDGVAFERIAAVDGSKDPPTTKGLSRFELACLESHRTTWRQLLNSPEDAACIVEDDVHVWPGLATLTESSSWIPPDAHSVKLDTYLQKVELGEKQAAFRNREIARLYSRHQSSAAYIVTRKGAARYLDLTTCAPLPADYALFPRHPRRLGLRIYQLLPAIAIQDHLLEPSEGAQAFTTAMAGTGGSAPSRRSSSSLEKLGREGVRLAAQVGDFAEWAYQKAVFRLKTTTVSVG